MSFVHQTYRDWIEEHEDGIVGAPAYTAPRRDVVSILDTQKHGLSGHGVLREIVADFLATSLEECQIRRCVEHLIDENGIEWVWRNRDIIADIMEFHGFIRKDAAQR